MKIELEDIKEITDLIAVGKPIAEAILDSVKDYGDVIDGFLEPIRKYLIDGRIKSILQLEAAGFTRDEAIVLTLDVDHAMLKAVQNTGKNVNKGEK